MQDLEDSVQSELQNDALNAFHKMRRLATLLFFLMAAIFIIAKIFEKQFMFISYVRAFAEAAMVGALADWFAVTALFRRPLGLPIPHTAIIPNSKDRIGNGLGNFIARNFLQPDQVQQRIEKIAISEKFAGFLLENDRSNQIAKGIAGIIPRVFSLLKESPINDWLIKTVKIRLQNADLSSLFADGLELLTRDKRHIPIVDLLILHTEITLHKYEPKFREKVSENTDWLPRLLKIDNTAADALLKALKESLTEAKHDNSHALRNSIDEALMHLIHNLRNDIKLRTQISDWQFEFSNHPRVAEYVTKIWSDLKGELAQTKGERHAAIVKAIEAGLKDLANALLKDKELASAFDAKIKTLTIELVAAQGDGVGKMVAETIKSWDATKVVTQIETAVGRDLQYIRINGTIIGGLVGLTIHILSELIFR